MRSESRVEPFLAAPKRSSQATMMLVQIVATPEEATRWATRPLGFRSRSDRMLVSRRYRNSAISEIHVLERLEVVDLWELLVKWFPGRQQLEQ